jgi:hypothetical protein
MVILVNICVLTLMQTLPLVGVRKATNLTLDITGKNMRI